MVEIKLTKGKVAIVDEEDYVRLASHSWYYGDDYAQRSVHSAGKQRTSLMHRETLQVSEGFQVDHINGDKLDNRKSNLRLATHQLNMFNRPACVGTSSIYKGVSWHKRKNKWMASARRDGISKFLGYFSNEEDAARAYNAAAVDLFGEYARLNQI